MAEIESSLLEKIHAAEGPQSQQTLTGWLRPRKKRIGTLIEAKDGQSLKELKRAVKKKGGKKLKVYKEINTLYAEMPVEHVGELASVTCAQKVYDAEGDITISLNESVPLVMGVEKWKLPYRLKHRKLEGHGIKVAVIDSGIDTKHPDLAWRVKKSKNLSGGRMRKGTEHGTHVAGIIAGSGKASGYRYVGVAPKATLYNIKVFINSTTPTTRPTIISAILWAVRQKADIINMSFGDNQGCSDGTCIVCKTADYAARQGVTVVAAAGNAGPAEGTISCPGNARQAITVGATTKTEPVVVAGFSGRGSPRQPDKPDIVAPGDHIMAAQPGGRYAALTGTSMAAPHVSGIAALLQQAAQRIRRKNRLAPEDVKQSLVRAGHDLGEHASAQGKGLINFEQELTILQPPKQSARVFKKSPATSPQNAFPEPDAATQFAPAGLSPEPTSTCPSALQGFCPHYSSETCNEHYSACIHYQAANQSKVLDQIKKTGQKTADTLPSEPTIHVLPQNVGSRKLVGKVFGSLSGQPLQRITVAAGGRSTTSNEKGEFSLPKAGKGEFPVVLSGRNVQLRTAVVKNTLTTLTVHLDAIELGSNFNLGFYRELVRGCHPGEWRPGYPMQPIHRWVSPKPPVIYLDTNRSNTFKKRRISRKTRKRVRAAIRQIVPTLSGGMYRKVRIKQRRFPTQDSYMKPDFSKVPNNAIVITFNDSLKNLIGIAHTSPDFLSPGISCIHKAWIFINTQEEIDRMFKKRQTAIKKGDPRLSVKHLIAHELGHAFGYRHTTKRDSLMNKGLIATFPQISEKELCCEADRVHMRLMYSRPVGNFDIDNDPVSISKTHTQSVSPVGPQVFIDYWEQA